MQAVIRVCNQKSHNHTSFFGWPVLKPVYLPFVLFFLLFIGCKERPLQTAQDWPTYGGNKANNRYSPLTQINLQTVKNLQVAWMYNAAEDADPNNPVQRPKAIQCQPIVVRGILYGTTADSKLFAVDAATGQQHWKFSPEKDSRKYYLNSNRGVVYWEAEEDKRILYSTGSTLYAVNASTGELVSSFGHGGKLDLHEGLQQGLKHDVSDLSVAATSPGVVYKNTLIIGSTVTEGGDAAPGHVRGFDVVTGKLKWVFHTIPQPGEKGYDTWPADAYQKFGGANSWGGMSVDEKRGVVYFGTGSPSSDYYGGDRSGTNLFANCVVALDAETGKLKWYYQTIHHDLWDRDIPCPPNLATIRQNGKAIEVVVAVTKDGNVYVLDRENGTPIFPVEERPAPTAGLPGEHPWPTQPFPVKPSPLCRQLFTEADITNLSTEAAAFIRERFRQMRTDNKFTPPNTKGTLLIGYSGGAEWGGNAVDPYGVFYQNSNEDPWELVMVDASARRKELASLSRGNALYVNNCSACHGMDQKGSGSAIPSLVGIEKRRSEEEIRSILKSGSGRMPSFQHLAEDDRNAIIRFLVKKESPKPVVDNEHLQPAAMITQVKKDFPYEPAYIIRSWRKLVDQNGYPGVKPPWGTLNAIDLNTGEYKWRVPLGEYPELAKKGVPVTGTESYGGPLVTAGGLLFIGGTRDEKIRAFDTRNGTIVWDYQLPAGGYATPITYEVDGKQYIVIAAGGARGGKAGGQYVAFSLK